MPVEEDRSCVVCGVIISDPNSDNAFKVKIINVIKLCHVTCASIISKALDDHYDKVMRAPGPNGQPYP